MPAATTSPFVKSLTGMRVFGREGGDARTDGLWSQDVAQRASDLAQFVAARKPAP